MSRSSSLSTCPPHITFLTVDTSVKVQDTETTTQSTCDSPLWKSIMDNLMLVLTIASVVVGIGLGLVLRSVDLSPVALQLVNFPGEIFMQVLKMMVLPLIVTSIISALSQMDMENAGKMGLMTIAYYATTAVIASALGIIFVTTIKPGTSSALPHSATKNFLASGEVEPIDTFLDLLRNMFPENIFTATFQRVSTKYDRGNGTSLVKGVVDGPGANIMGVLVFCTFFGLVAARLGEKVRSVIDFFIALDAIIMGMIMVLMWFAPLGIISLLSGHLLEVDDVVGTFQTLALYVYTVILGLSVHILIVTPTLYFILTIKSPIPVYRTMIQPFIIAFGTASSGAALPASLSCLTEFGIDERVANFVPPLGNTINVDGNALYEAVAVIYIAQLNDIHLTFANVITISITATLASIGSGSVPAGLVTMVLILNTVGLPIKDLSLIITVDWLLDRIRTAINVMGDGFATCAIAHNVGVDLNAEEDYQSIHSKSMIEDI